MKVIEKVGKRVIVKTVNNEPTMTQQDQKKEADINTLVEKYTKKGMPLPQKHGFYADFSEIGTLQEAAINLQNAEDAFMMLPAHVRREFDNDPVQMLQQLEDPQNRAKFEALGIIEQTLPPEPIEPIKPIEPPKES